MLSRQGCSSDFFGRFGMRLGVWGVALIWVVLCVLAVFEVDFRGQVEK